MKVTVGENIERLSVICNDKDFYLSHVFPAFEEILNDSDELSKIYLIDCIVQAFPDEFHLHTIKEFMKLSIKIQLTADIIDMVLSILNRILLHLKENQKNIDKESLDSMKEYLGLLAGADLTKKIQKKTELVLVVMKFSNKSEEGVQNTLFCLENCMIVIEAKGNLELSSLLNEILSFSLEISLTETLTCPYFAIIYAELEENDKLKLADKLIEAINSNDTSENIKF